MGFGVLLVRRSEQGATSAPSKALPLQRALDELEKPEGWASPVRCLCEVEARISTKVFIVLT